MLVSKKLVESVLSDNLKQLINENNSENLNTVVENLLINLEQVKNEINDLKQVGFDKIEPEILKTEDFIAKLNNLHGQINNIKNELNEQENLLKNVSQIEEYKNLIDHIEMINKTIIVIESLRDYQTCLSEFKLSIECKNYKNCFELSSKLITLNATNLFFKTNSSTEGQILVIKDLKEEFVIQRERLWYELDQDWDQLIKINECRSEILIDKTNLNQNYFSLLTKFSILKPSKIENLNLCFLFAQKLKNFCKQFIKLIQFKIINSSKLNQIECSIEQETIKLSFREMNSTLNSPIDILDFKLNQIENFLKFLYNYLFNYQVFIGQTEKSGLIKENSIKFIFLFSDLTLNEFIKLIHEQLIINIIPINEFDSSLEQKIFQKLSEFEEKLKKIDYLKANDKEFKNFLSNIEELYVRKKCKFIIDSARGMIKNQDLIFDLVDVEESTQNIRNIKNNKLINELLKLEENKKNLEKKNNMLYIPKLKISKTVKQFLDLIQSTLNEAYNLLNKNKQSVKSVTLFCLIARNLFDLYSSIVPSYYSNNLKQLPKLSAIVFNDFYYLSLNCLLLGHKYKILIKNLKNEFSNDINYIDLDELIQNFNFIDFVPKLYSIGYDILAKQVEKQERNLIEFLNEDCPNGIRDLSEANNYEKFKKSLQKCIYQINNLSSMWKDVLTERLYFKLIGQLFDLVLNDLVKGCLNLEDISSDDASYLHSAFSVIKQSVIDFYTNTKTENQLDTLDISSDLANLSLTNNLADLNSSKNINTWNRFKYLMIILKASLAEIVDLWSDGKGPLALHFNSEDIRHLIRALFMNNDRRSAALIKIK